MAALLLQFSTPRVTSDSLDAVVIVYFCPAGSPVLWCGAFFIASAYRKRPPRPSGLNAKNSIFGHTKTVLIESGLFCMYLKIEYVIFPVSEKKYSEIIIHRSDMCTKIE